VPSRCEIEVKPDGLFIRIKPERSLWDFIATPLIGLVIVPLAIGWGWAAFFIWGLFTWLVWNFRWNAFGEENINAGLAGIEISSRVLFLQRTRRFAKETIESLAYHPHAYRSPAGIGMMVKDRLIPFQFAKNLEPKDAEVLLNDLKANVEWAANKIRTAG
jgi:hypothetical protein